MNATAGQSPPLAGGRSRVFIAVPIGRLAYVAGTLSILLGLAVLAGWHAQIATLIQILPDLAPMQYNTAVGFVAAGLGLVALNRSRRRLAVVLVSSALLMLLGGITLAQYLLHVDLGVDRLLMEPFLTIRTSHPGRMAPNAALCFALTGAGLATAALSGPLLATAAFGAVIAALGLVPMFGYLGGVETAYAWGNLTHVAAHTAVGFVVIGTGLTWQACACGRDASGSWPRWLPAPVALGVLTISIALWQAAHAGERGQVRRALSTTADALAAEIVADLEARLLDLQRMASRWETRGRTPREEWEADAQGYIGDQPWYHALLWLDARGQRRWSVRANTVDAPLGPDLAPYCRGGTDSTSPARLTRTFSLDGIGAAFLACKPLFPQGHFDGFLVGAFLTQPLLEAIVPIETRARFGMAVRDGNQTIFAAAHSDDIARWSHTVDVTIADDLRWTLQLWPSANFIRSLTSPLPQVLLFVGVLLSGLLALAVNLAQTARTQARALEGARDELEDRVRERTETLEATVQELQRSNRDLDDFAYVASHDLRSPLRDIDNLAHWISEDLRDAVTPESSRHLSLLKQRARRIERLLDDLLQYSRAGRTPVAPETVHTEALLGAVVELFSPPGGFQLRLPSQGPVLHTPRAPLEQVLFSLVDNAVKHHDRGDGCIEISVHDGDEFVTFSVSDDGPGIPRRFHERVFRTFQSLRPRDEVDGSGIGLALAKKLVESFGGRIWLDSRQGLGCKVSFTWPKRGQHAEAEREPQTVTSEYRLERPGAAHGPSATHETELGDRTSAD